MNAICFKESLCDSRLLIFVAIPECGHSLQSAMLCGWSKPRKSALTDTSFFLLPSPSSVTALADLHAPHKPHKHFHFLPYMMALTSLNCRGIHRELAVFLCPVLLLVRRPGSGRLPRDCSTSVGGIRGC